MILEGIIFVVAAAARGVAALLGTLSLPGWFEDLAAKFGDVADYAAGYGMWVPFGWIGNAIGFVMLVLGLSLLIRLVRIIASFLTAGGGSAA